MEVCTQSDNQAVYKLLKKNESVKIHIISVFLHNDVMYFYTTVLIL